MFAPWDKRSEVRRREVVASPKRWEEAKEEVRRRGQAWALRPLLFLFSPPPLPCTSHSPFLLPPPARRYIPDIRGPNKDEHNTGIPSWPRPRAGLHDPSETARPHCFDEQQRGGSSQEEEPNPVLVHDVPREEVSPCPWCRSPPTPRDRPALLAAASRDY